MGELTKTRRVLERIGVQHGDPGLAAYQARVEDGDDARTVTYFDLPSYIDMGSPKLVTVTIEPGDRLNEGDDR